MSNKKPNTSGLKPFQKGTSGNLKGRPRIAKPVKPMIEKLLEKSYPKIEKEFIKATPEDRRAFYLDLTRVLTIKNNTQ